MSSAITGCIKVNTVKLALQGADVALKRPRRPQLDRRRRCRELHRRTLDGLQAHTSDHPILGLGMQDSSRIGRVARRVFGRAMSGPRTGFRQSLRSQASSESLRSTVLGQLDDRDFSDGILSGS